MNCHKARSQNIRAGYFVLLVALLSVALSCNKISSANEDEQQGKRDEYLVAITLACDHSGSKIYPDEKLTFRENIDKDYGGNVSIVFHRVYLLAKYDVSKDSMTLLSRMKECDVDAEFEGLSSSIAYFDGHPQYTNEKNTKYLEYTIQPRRPGIYLIVTKWTCRNEGKNEYVASTPCVMTVDVPRGKDGKPEFKKHWTRE